MTSKFGRLSASYDGKHSGEGLATLISLSSLLAPALITSPLFRAWLGERWGHVMLMGEEEEEEVVVAIWSHPCW